MRASVMTGIRTLAIGERPVGARPVLGPDHRDKSFRPKLASAAAPLRRANLTDTGGVAMSQNFDFIVVGADLQGR
jgi:hypothetical protein